MSETQLNLSDQSFLSATDVQEQENNSSSSDSKDSNGSESINLSGDLSMIEEIVSNADILQAAPKLERASEKNAAVSEERTTESPSTGESYIFKCVFCESTLNATDDPKLLECLHNACGTCVNNKLYEQNDGPIKGILCTTCGVICEPDSIIDNQFLLELTNVDDGVTKPTELKCNSCNDDILATSWCVDCAEFICDICVQAHQRLKITKDHTIKPKEEGIQENNTLSTSLQTTTLFCTTHPHEKLSLFCESCDKLTCRDCQLTEHRDHKYKFTHEIASDARKFISSMLKDISYKKFLLKGAMKFIADRQSLVSEKKKTLVKEITQLVVKLTNTINMRGKQLVTKLNEVCDAKQKTLHEKKLALDQLSKMTDHCIDFTKHALESGSDMALLYSKKQVTNHLQRIKSKKADIPNPDIPVRIHLALDKVPDLIKVISTIGQIVVDGRVYPSQPSSPSTSMTPQSSPSPGHQNGGNSFQQQPGQQLVSPMMHSPGQQQMPHQQLSHHIQQQTQQQQQHQSLQQMHSNYQSPRMLPPYQPYNQNMGNVNQNLQQALGSKLISNVNGNGPHQSNNSMTLTQQLQHSSIRQQLPLSLRPGLNSQQQVTSSTHPQGMMQDRSNLRGLLQPNGNAVYVQTGPGQYQAVQPQYAQQFQNRFHGVPQYRQQSPMPFMSTNQQQGNNQQRFQNVRMPSMLRPRQSFAPPFQQQQQQQNLRWHTPQQNDATGNTVPSSRPGNNNQSQLYINDHFKITLKPQNQADPKNLPTAVSSTIPKTPSPNHVHSKSDTETTFDKYCEDSVKDLIATIAKLDSNGVQVLAETRPKTGGSPHVDSSTGDNIAGSSNKLKSEVMETGKDDPNEDWCAVCMDGGELVCCDKCPKVFHQSCHIPNLSIEENDTWQCLLCMNFADIPDNVLGEKKESELSPRERKIAERLVLELYCQFEPSIPFREVISADNIEYHSIIKKPIALDVIRHKLDWNSTECYTHLEQLVRDCRLMFHNAYKYNEPGTGVFNDAKTLEKFFDEQLEKWLPEYAYEMFEDDDLTPPAKKFKRIISD